jgi:hypothetical protein
MHPRRYVLVVLTLAACLTAPLNGTVVDGPVIGKSIEFQGFWNQPNELIRLQIMTDPTRDPALASSWVQFATARSSTEPLTVNHPDPLFGWSVTAIPVPNATVAARWPQGGLARVRAVHINPAGETEVTVSFDAATFDECLNTQLSAGADWVAIGIACEGLGRNSAALVSTTNVPVQTGSAANGDGYLGRKRLVTPAQTTAYYTAIGAPATLAQFRTAFGFPTGEITATYYNDTDLGLGREVHCKAIAGGGAACFITSYTGVAGTAVFDRDPTVVVADAVARVRPFVTLAMIHDGTANNNSVKFMAYNAAGNLTTTVALDSTANNPSIPNNCLACHGINATFTPATNVVTGDAKLLPFDPFNFRFSTAAGFTFAAQADAIRRLNALVRATRPTNAIAQLIDGMYAPRSVNDAAAVANNTFMPPAWATLNGNLHGKALYNGFIKVGCRTCHVSAAAIRLDFDAPTDITALASFTSITRIAVCRSHAMPHAERTMRRFWQSGARAYFVTGFPGTTFPDTLQSCAP